MSSFKRIGWISWTSLTSIFSTSHDLGGQRSEFGCSRIITGTSSPNFITIAMGYPNFELYPLKANSSRQTDRPSYRGAPDLKKSLNNKSLNCLSNSVPISSLSNWKVQFKDEVRVYQYHFMYFFKLLLIISNMSILMSFSKYVIR